MRRREDAELLKLFPSLRMVDLNLKDALLRLRCTADEVYTLAPSPEDTASAKIQKALAKLSVEQAIDAVLIPLGLGHHVDHLVVRNAVLPFAANHSSAFYEDLPDALLSSTDLDATAKTEITAMRESSLFTELLSPTILRAGEDSAIAANIKRRIVSIYASQIDDANIDAISNFSRNYAGGERVWANAAFLGLSL